MRCLFSRRAVVALLFTPLLLDGCTEHPSSNVTFSQSGESVEAYDFLEVTARVTGNRGANPFTDAALRGVMELADGSKRWQVEGFCDASDGSLFRIRFMPPARGDYKYAVEFGLDGARWASRGTFQAKDGHRRGPVRVDPKYRWHFIWEGTGEHYFFNGTTAYWLMGWRDDSVIEASIERLHRLKINRIRVTVAGRTSLFYGEPAMVGPDWTTLVTPWPASKAEDIYHPGFDYSRFHIPYWQKFERALRFARDRDVIMSLVLDMNDSRVHPAAGSADEHRFIRYAVARFGAFSNITWDLGDDFDSYRDDKWARATGTLIKEWDPYRHLATSHPAHNEHQDRTADWFDFTSLQEWSRTQHDFMLRQRKLQLGLGRIIPQTNEEYGYEDHYPRWAPREPGSESADTLRRTAWDIVMAGGYQTTGESARRGTHIGSDSGGGWLNGRGDETMVMLNGYEHMVDFFTAFNWWETEPHDELVNNGNYCLASPGSAYAIYLPRGGSVTVRQLVGQYYGTWFNARTGERVSLPSTVVGPEWTSPVAPDAGDWALLLRRK
jgi:hypothetical protein